MLKDEIIVSKLKRVFKQKGYKFFTKGAYNLNVIGVRGNNRVANSYDDWLFCAYKKGGEWKVDEYTITTDAGNYWLKNPMNRKGTAILKANQYRSAYKLDLHSGKYLALCQRKGKVDVYRDNDKDYILEMDESTIDRGMFGINIHRSSEWRDVDVVEKYSAGCQVFQKKKEFDVFIELCEKSADIYGNSFTYTLINLKDLNL